MIKDYSLDNIVFTALSFILLQLDDFFKLLSIAFNFCSICFARHVQFQIACVFVGVFHLS